MTSDDQEQTDAGETLARDLAARLEADGRLGGSIHPQAVPATDVAGIVGPVPIGAAPAPALLPDWARPETAGAPAPAPTRRLTVRSWADELAGPPPAEPPMLVDPVLHAGSTCVLAAPRALGKSFAAYNLAWLVGTGSGALFDALPVLTRARVLIAAGETDRYSSWMRLARMNGGAGGSSTAPQVWETNDPWRVGVTLVTEDSPSLSGTRERRQRTVGELDPELEQTIRELGIGLLIVDPWARYYAGDENSNDQTEAALAQLSGLAERTGCAVVIVHHLGKATEGRDPEDLWRGASRLGDWPATRITMLPHFTQRSAAERGLSWAQARRYVNIHFTCRHTYQEGFSAQLRDNGWWTQWMPEAGTPPAPGATAPGITASAATDRLTPADVAAKLAASGGSWGSVKEAQLALGVSERRARKALDEAATAGLVDCQVSSSGVRRYSVPGGELL